MKAFLMLALGLVLVSCQEQAGGSGSTTLKNTDDSVSYSIGLSIGKSSTQDSLNLNPDLLAAGIRDAVAKKPMLTDSQTQNVMNAFNQRMMEKQQAKMMQMQDSMRKAGEGNKTAGEKFLAENKTKPGVVTLPSGLQYQVITEGTGPMPKSTDEVKVHYRGTTIDGTVFDSSIDRGEPVTFGVTGVIPGWSEALQLMKVGSKWKLFIPAELAYGANPPDQKIGPNSVLLFDVELLEIVKKGANNLSTPNPGSK